MKKTLFLIAVLLCAGASTAQEIYAPAKKGVVLIYERTESDWKNREITFSGTTFRHTVTDVKEDGDNLLVTYLNETVFPGRRKEKVELSEKAVAVRRGDAVYVDLRDITYRERQRLAEQNAAGVEAGGASSRPGSSGFNPMRNSGGIKLVDFGKDVYVSGEIGIPLDAQPGDTIPQTTLYLERRAVVATKCDVETTNWKIEALAEEVTVPAGTFPCIKLTCDVVYRFRGVASLTNLGANKPSPHTFWYAKGIGLVKMESLRSDTDSSLDKTIELVEVRNL